MAKSYAQIILEHLNILGDKLSDESLETFIQECFEAVISDRGLWPYWLCMDCKTGGYGKSSRSCIHCGSRRVFEVATFQGRGAVTGGVFQEAVKYLLDTYYPGLEIQRSDGTQFKDHCDLFAPEVAGIEIKGSPAKIRLPDGNVITFDRPGMQRTDTEKKANSNANTFKEDYKALGFDTRFYVLTNAVPIGWQEAHSNIDEIYDVTKAKQWEEFAYDIYVDRRRAGRSRLGRR
jgi:hypothetical protein